MSISPNATDVPPLLSKVLEGLVMLMKITQETTIALTSGQNDNMPFKTRVPSELQQTSDANMAT